MKKLLASSLFLLTLVFVSGCSPQEDNTETEVATPENTEVVNTEDTSASMDTEKNGSESDQEEANWSTYNNDEYGLHFDYPSNWKLQEYKDPDTNKLAAVAVDPISVMSNDEFLSQDKYAGLVEFKLNAGVDNTIGVNGLPEEKIGKQAVNARKNEDADNANSPNPAYQGKHSITYYVSQNDIVIQFVSDPEDTEGLDAFNKILNSVSFDQ